MNKNIVAIAILITTLNQSVLSQSSEPPKQSPQNFRGNPAETEVWEPSPVVVKPGKQYGEPPSDAVILFNGANVDEWVSTRDKSPINWTVQDGALVVNKSVRGNNIETKRSFKNYQLHLEWMVPPVISGEGQARGNSGLFLASTGNGDAGYEVQILDSYNNENKTYVNGMAGSIYKQFIPLANPTAKAGEWNIYDIAWIAPTFNEDGSLKSPARVTVFLNGVLIQNQIELKGETVFIGQPKYKPYQSAPIKLQAHGDPSEPVRFRNIWVREN